MRRALFLCAALTACSGRGADGKDRPSPDLPSSAAPSSSTTAAPILAASASAQVPSRLLAPPAASASREEREKAALLLLSGEARPSELPVIDADRGEDFEPLLRAMLQMRMDIRIQTVSVTALDEPAIRLAVDSGMRRLRLCYTGGVRRNPNLMGRISVRVVVKAAGRPLFVDNAGSDLPDSGVIACCLRAFERMDFPAPAAPHGIGVVSLHMQPW